jgi:hypothetical protein
MSFTLQCLIYLCRIKTSLVDPKEILMFIWYDVSGEKRYRQSSVDAFG